MVSSLVLRSSLRFFQRHPAQLILSILGILLGVGIVTAVIITNSSSQRAFALSAKAVTGAATHQITGAEFGVHQSVYASLKRTYGFAMAPVIEGHLSINEELFTVLGIDPFADADFGRVQSLVNSELAQSLITTPNALMISTRTIERTNLALDSTYQADAGSHTTDVHLVGQFTSDNPAASDGILIGDIAAVQSLFKRGEYIDHIDLILGGEEAKALSAILPLEVELIPANSRANTMREMTHGFQINLTAMSLLGLLVGAFLIHNTMTFSILRRRELFAVMRITGITSAGIFASILAEILLVSIVGSLLGLAIGYLLAHYLIGLTTQTINDLYFVLHVQDVWFNPLLAAGIVLAGVITSLLAATAAASEAALVSPVQARMRSMVETRSHKILPLLALSGLLLMALGSGLAAYPSRSLVLGFASMMLVIVGFGIIIPWLVKTITTFLHKPSALFGTSTQLAIGGIERSISRTGLAIAALTIAVAATFGVDIMIGSFRSTVDTWLGKTLSSDIYITLPNHVSTKTKGLLQADLLDNLESIQGVAETGTTRLVNTNTNIGYIDTLILDPHSRSQFGFDFLSGDSDAIWQKFLHKQGILISEPLANRHQLSVGDTLQLFTAISGYQPMKVAGIYFDYGSSHGRITISRATYNNFWQDRSYASIGINVHDTAETDSVLLQVRERIAQSKTRLLVRSNHEIRTRSLEIFDRTFQVTRVLRLLTVAVAFVGIFSALLALQLEKSREFAVLRASGATQWQVGWIVIIQTIFMGTLAGLLAIPLGWMMSEILIQVINKRSFGWSMNSLLPRGSTTATLVLAITSATLAGIYPAWKLCRANIASQLRDE